MDGLLKPKYLLIFLILVLLVGLISIFVIREYDNSRVVKSHTKALTENDFVKDTSLKGNPEDGVIVTFLEHPDSEKPERDTGGVGFDEIPLTYARSVKHTLCWKDGDKEAGHFMELNDSEGNEVLRVDANGECVTKVIESGNYIMTFHHDGRGETSLAIFIIPNPDDNKQAKKSDVLFDRIIIAAANIVDTIERTLIKEAKAQSVEENIETLLSTKSCPGCYLAGADLTLANLNGANLRGADLTYAYSERGDFSDADFRDADLSGAIFAVGDMGGADFTGAYMVDTQFIQSTATSAIFQNADMTDAYLSDSYLIRATLLGANLSGAELFGTDLSIAIWCDSCICDAPSIGECAGCPPAEKVCIGK